MPPTVSPGTARNSDSFASTALSDDGGTSSSKRFTGSWMRVPAWFSAAISTSGVILRKSPAALIGLKNAVSVSVTAMSSTSQPCRPCRRLRCTVSSIALWNANGSEPSSTERPNVTPEPGGPGSTRSPTVAQKYRR